MGVRNIMPCNKDINAIYKDNYKNMVKYARKLLIEKSDAEDITQEAFTLALKQKDKYINAKDPKQWFYGTLSLLCKEANRKIKVNISIDDEANKYITDKIIDCNDMTESITPITDKQAELLYDEILSMLSYKERILYDLRFISHKNEHQIAEELNISYNACRKQISRLKSKLFIIIKKMIIEKEKENENYTKK